MFPTAEIYKKDWILEITSFVFSFTAISSANFNYSSVAESFLCNKHIHQSINKFMCCLLLYKHNHGCLQPAELSKCQTGLISVYHSDHI